MALSKESLASLNALAFGKKPKATAATSAPVVRRKRTPVAEKPVILTHWPVMFPDDVLCPEWSELVAWARQAPLEAFEILPFRAPHKNARQMTYGSKEALRAAILAELDEAGLTVVVGLIYELRTLKERWEQQCA